MKKWKCLGLLLIASLMSVTKLANGTGLTIELQAKKMIPEFADIHLKEGGIDTAFATMVDLNSDTYPDLVVLPKLGAARYYLNNKTSNPFLNVEYVTFSDSMEFSDGELVDINGDLKLDLVAAIRGGKNKLIVNKGTIEEPFKSTSIIDVGDDVGDTTSIAVGDIDNDSDLDIVVGNTSEQYNFVYLNNGTEEPFKDVIGQEIIDLRIDSERHNTMDIALGDYDGDSYLDLFVANIGATGGKQVAIYFNNGTDNPFYEGSSILFSEVKDALSISVADLDGDSDLDFVVGSGPTDSHFYIYRNDGKSGSNGYQNYHYSYVKLNKPIGLGVVSTQLGEFNGDQKIDLLAVYQNTEQGSAVAAQVFLNDGYISPFEGSQGIDVSNNAFEPGTTLALGDLDKNNENDVVGINAIGIHQNVNSLVTDNTPPTFEILNNIENNASILKPFLDFKIEILAKDYSGIDNIAIEMSYSDADGVFIPYTWDNNWSGISEGPYLSITIREISETTHKLTVIVTDASGNKTERELSFSIVGEYSKVDLDGDGMPDQWENKYGLKARDGSDAEIDSDGDSILNIDEFFGGTAPNNVDTDGDDINDNIDSNPTHDDLPPVINIIDFVDGATVLKPKIRAFEFKADIIEKGGIQSTEVLLNGEVIRTGKASAIRQSILTLPVDENDNYLDLTFKVICKDLADNKTEKSVTIKIVDDPNLVDTDADGMTDVWEQSYNFDPLDPTDGAGDKDEDGLTNAEEYRYSSHPELADSDWDGVDDYLEVQNGQDPSVDDIAPVIEQVLEPIVVPATGLLTKVEFPSVFALDGRDGALEATPSKAGPYKSGRHEITWVAVDREGNRGEKTQILDVVPMVNFTVDHFVEEGTQPKLYVHLSGKAPSYPVTVDVVVNDFSTAQENYDFSLATRTIEINDGYLDDLGYISLSLHEDGLVEDREMINLSLVNPQNAILGVKKDIELTIIEENIAPRVFSFPMQGGEMRRIVARDQGLVTFFTSISDVNLNDNHSIEIDAEDSIRAAQVEVENSLFTFDPESVEAGLYEVKVTVQDDGAPKQSTVFDMVMKVVDTAESVEELLDRNMNGIPNNIDRTTQSNHLPARDGNENSHMLLTQQGLILHLGSIALAGEAKGAEILQSEIDAFMSGKTTLDTIDVDNTNVGGYFDFDILGLPIPGMTVDVVLPLKTAIPENAIYRKFSPESGWKDFVENSNNRLSSAQGEYGNCPLAGSSDYKPGLIKGNLCVQLSIEDGGPNDMDGRVNGVIRDPGGIAINTLPEVEAAEPEEEATETSYLGGGGSIDAVMLMMLLIMYGYFHLARYYKI